MKPKVEDLIDQGTKFNFENNCYRYSHGTYSRASDELLAWVAHVEHFIIENYDENSGPFNLFKTFKKSNLTGYDRHVFDKQLAILRGTLKACKQIPPKKNQKHDSLIISLLNNPVFWTATVVLVGASFSLGLYFGTSKFDKEKNDLYEENKVLKKEIQTINLDRARKDSSLQALKEKINLVSGKN